MTIRSRLVSLAVMSLVIVLASSTPTTAQKDAAQPIRVRISQPVLKALIVRRVLPEYPEAALKRHLDGAVTITVLIDTHGDVEKTSNAAGDPLLVLAVTDSVKQWKFKPYYLNRKPVPIESQVTITFELKDGKGTVHSAI